MFLTYLSDSEYEERYWAFVLKFETLVCGVVLESSKKIEAWTDDQASDFFSEAFACALDTDSGVVPLDWWKDVHDIPSVEWLQRYLDKELPFMIREARRVAKTSDAYKGGVPIDRVKIKRLARRNAAFQHFLLGDERLK